jgi:hypothetical protein
MLHGLFAQLESEPDQKIVRDAWVGAPASIATVVTLPDSVVRMLANTRATVLSTAVTQGWRVLDVPDLLVYIRAVSARSRRLLAAGHRKAKPRSRRASHLPKNGLE